MKVKTLEALALGVPVVTTPEGAEGIPPNDGVVIATSDNVMADHTISLLTDPKERAERSAAARAAFEDHLSPAVVGAQLKSLYGSIIDRS